MKKIIFTILIMLILNPTNTKAKKIDCAQFDKVSAKYLECSAKNLKEKSGVLKLKVTLGAEELKTKIAANTKDSKKKFNKSNLKEKLIKFKNSKTLTEFMEK
jgi:hypothetical protein|tara:strand:- start:593 stop:898 length:306 start_codon:yes stop_codon:yes gene_type:complete